MNYARLEKSRRLQKVLRLLADGQKHSTREIILATGACAVNSIIEELRLNKVNIPPAEFDHRTSDGNSVFVYWWPMEGRPEFALEAIS